MKSLLLISILSLFSLSCGQETIQGNGKIITETRNVSAGFSGVHTSGSFDIHIQDGPQDGKIKIEGDEKIIEKITVEVKDNQLHIGFQKGFSLRFSKTIKISFRAKNLSTLALSGSGTIQADGTQNVKDFTASLSGSGDINAKVKAVNTSASISGSGDIVLAGETDEFSIGISGSGDISAFKLIAQNVNVRVSGSGDSEISVKNSLTGSVAGSGDIRYKGNPSKIKVNASGSGDIIQVN